MADSVFGSVFVVEIISDCWPDIVLVTANCAVKECVNALEPLKMPEKTDVHVAVDIWPCDAVTLSNQKGDTVEVTQESIMEVRFILCELYTMN